MSALKIYRMHVTNRVSGAPIRYEHVKAENIDAAFDVVRAKLGAFEACAAGSRA